MDAVDFMNTGDGAGVVIFGLDGTLADNTHREHFIKGDNKDWDAFFDACDEDEPNEAIIVLTRLFTKLGYYVIIWTGRSEVVERKTVAWLRKHGVYFDTLRMHPKGDYIPDDELKHMWLRQLPARPDYVFDDRDKVVAMWRRNGITCLQVEKGDF